ncbi:hypothetical protein D3C85_1313490 [compost metagenome]
MAIEAFVIQGAQRLGPRGGHRPDDGAEVGLPQGQEGERAFGGEDLARHRLVGLGTAHRRHQGVVAIIPAGERDVRLAAHPGVGAVGGHHHASREGTAILHQQQGARRTALQAGGPGRGEQADVVRPRNGIEQRQLDDPVLDDMAERRLA